MTANKPALTWGHQLASWEAAKVEAMNVLSAKAKSDSPTIFYSDLARLVFAVRFQPEGHDFHALLGQVSEESDAEGKGMISALVIRQEEGIRAKAFSPSQKSWGENLLTQLHFGLRK